MKSSVHEHAFSIQILSPTAKGIIGLQYSIRKGGCETRKCRMSVLRSFSPKGSRVKHWTLLRSHVCSCWRIHGGGVLINSLASLWSALNSSRVHRHKNAKSFGGTKLCSPPPVIFSSIGTPKTLLYINSFEFSGEMSSHMMGGGGGTEIKRAVHLWEQQGNRDWVCSRWGGSGRAAPNWLVCSLQPTAAAPPMCSPPAGARSRPLPSLQHDQK
jgi:hypothetical protein